MDEEFQEKKKEVRKKLIKWRKEKSSGEEYMRKSKEYTELSDKKKSERNQKIL